MPVIPIDSVHPFRPVDDRLLPVVTGVSLMLALAFSTLTVFITAAWPEQIFQIAVFFLVGWRLLAGIHRTPLWMTKGFTPWFLYLIPAWGVGQIITHTTASTFDTRQVLLRWAALAGVFFLTTLAADTKQARRQILSAFLAFATAMAILCLTQLFTSEGKVMWLFPTGYPDVYGTFPSYNNYAQLIELALPISAWRFAREGWRSWPYALGGGILYGSVIGSASRAGTALCTLELLVIVVIALFRRGHETGRVRTRVPVMVVFAIPLVAAVFTSIVGWERVWLRFQQNDPYLVRREFLAAAVDMAKHKPLTGYGLGVFPEVYQKYAIRDFPLYVNHAHNDWAEFAAEGGIPFLLLVSIPLIFALPAAVRHPWGLGVAALMLHACVDFPFQRPPVAGWFFLLLGLLAMESARDTSEQAAVTALRLDHKASMKL